MINVLDQRAVAEHMQRTLSAALLENFVAMQAAEIERARQAHLKRWNYEEIGPALTRAKGGVKKAAPALYRGGQPVKEYRRHSIAFKRYDGEKRLALEAERGCGHIGRRLGGNMVRIRIPWNGDERFVRFDVADTGEGLAMSNMTLHRKTSRIRRDVRLENALSDEQWDSIIREVARAMKRAI